MIQVKSECDSTSITPSSSPKRPVYYVQSPSRDSHEDGDKSSASQSIQTTPAYNSSSSPMDYSPSYPSTYGRTTSNYRSSSASRVSGHWRWSKVNRKRNSKQWWRECRVVGVENGAVFYDDDDDNDEIYEDEREESRGRPYFLIIFLGFSLVFTAFCLIIWGASKPYKAHIRMMVYIYDLEEAQIFNIFCKIFEFL